MLSNAQLVLGIAWANADSWHVKRHTSLEEGLNSICNGLDWNSRIFKIKYYRPAPLNLLTAFKGSTLRTPWTPSSILQHVTRVVHARRTKEHGTRAPHKRAKHTHATQKEKVPYKTYIQLI